MERKTQTITIAGKAELTERRLAMASLARSAAVSSGK
jgi:hypothetical protein